MKAKFGVLALITFALLGCEQENFAPASSSPVILKTESIAKLHTDPGDLPNDPNDPICMNSREELISQFRELATEMCQDLVVCIPACPGEPGTLFYTMVISHQCVYDAPPVENI